MGYQLTFSIKKYKKLRITWHADPAIVFLFLKNRKSVKFGAFFEKFLKGGENRFYSEVKPCLSKQNRTLNRQVFIVQIMLAPEN